MSKQTRKRLTILLAGLMVLTTLTACNPTTPASTDAATTAPPATTAPAATTAAPATTEPIPEVAAPLVVGIDTLSQKFNQFNYASAYDANVYTLTHDSLMQIDRSGEIVFNAIAGETRTYEGAEYYYNNIADLTVTRDEANNTTTYKAKLRDDIYFSDGVKMTVDDIIFTMYATLDNSYTGLSSLKSYPIQGLKNYLANNSMAESVDVAAEIADIIKNPTAEDTAFITETFIVPLLTDELDWVKSIYGNANYKNYTDAFPVAKDLFAEFYSIDENYDASKVTDEAQVLADVIAQYGIDYKTLAANYGDGGMFDADMESYAILRATAGTTAEEVPNVSGIRKISDFELEIVLDGFSAPAVYSILGQDISPMHYYGDKALYDYANNKFGFTRGDISLITAAEKTTNPMGSGAYKFIKYENKVVYYEANELYWRGEPITKEFQYKETITADLVQGVTTGTIDIANPSGNKTTVAEISAANPNGQTTGDVITSVLIDNPGYGYLGLNALTMNVGGELGSDASKNLRRGFATILAVYRDVAVDTYYGELAQVINYPISNTSWAAPQKTDEDYQVAFSKDVDGKQIYDASMTQEQKYDAALKAAIGFFKAAGYTFDEASGKFTAAPEGALMTYECIIPGNGTGEHPAFGILTDAKAALESIGLTLEINDPADANVLWNKIDTGTQHMWTAAWSSSVDPDMYQLYHSRNITGAPGGTGSNRYHIISDELDQLIMDGRSSADNEYRKAVYKAALEEIIDWAVELPTYQRKNYYIFSTERVNLDTVTPAITTNWSWAHDLQLLEMK